MDTDDLGHLDHREGLQTRDAFFHELALAMDDFPGNVEDRLLPLVQALDQKLPGPDFLANVVAHLGGVLALGHQILVCIADAQVRNVVVIGRHHEIAIRAMNEDFRQDVLIVIREKSTARAWLQPRDAFQRLLHVIHVMVGAAGDLRDAPFSERLHKLVNDAIFQSVLLT